MAKKSAKSKSKPTRKIEKEITPEIWQCKDSWVQYKGIKYTKGQEILIMPGSLTEDDEKILGRHFEKMVTKTETIISEPIELAEGE